MKVFFGIITAILLIGMIAENDREKCDRITIAFYMSMVALLLVSVL